MVKGVGPTGARKAEACSLQGSKSDASCFRFHLNLEDAGLFYFSFTFTSGPKQLVKRMMYLAWLSQLLLGPLNKGTNPFLLAIVQLLLLLLPV